MVDDEAPLGLVHQREAVEGAFGPAQAEQQPQQAGRHDTRPACSPGRGGHFVRSREPRAAGNTDKESN